MSKDKYFVDLHIHIGRTKTGQSIKISASKNLTLDAILYEAADRKGLNIIGIVDAASPPVIEEIEGLIDRGELVPLSGGGFRYEDRLTLILGAEFGASSGGGEAHYLSYFPTIQSIKAFSRSLRPYVTNIQLSSQKTRLHPKELLHLTDDHDGVFMLAHAFTPHKGYYGISAMTLADAFSPVEIDLIPGIELGLSADTNMASTISELDGKTFLSHSDAHSLQNIAREYVAIEAACPDYSSLVRVLRGVNGRIVANYGLDPRLGKYHRTFCSYCARSCALLVSRRCPYCDGKRITVGVADRLSEVADRPPKTDGRPPYIHQIPLQFIPGVGRKTIDRLLAHFGTEMTILHDATADELREVINTDVADMIVQGRSGRLVIDEGGGGVYGRPSRR